MGMIFFENLSEPRLRGMGVHLGCGKMLVAQHFLHGPDISSLVQQLSSEAVAERMRGYPPDESRFPGAPGHDVVYPAHRDPAAPVVNEERIRDRAELFDSLRKVSSYRINRSGRKEYDPLVSSLAVYLEPAGVEIEIRHVREAELGNPGAG